MAMQISDLTFGELLVVLRRRKNMSQRDLAALMGVSKSAVAYWEGGGVRLSKEQLEQLAEVLEVDYSTVLDAYIATYYGDQTKASKLSRRSTLAPLPDTAAA